MNSDFCMHCKIIILMHLSSAPPQKNWQNLRVGYSICSQINQSLLVFFLYTDFNSVGKMTFFHQIKSKKCLTGIVTPLHVCFEQSSLRKSGLNFSSQHGKNGNKKGGRIKWLQRKDTIYSSFSPMILTMTKLRSYEHEMRNNESLISEWCRCYLYFMMFLSGLWAFLTLHSFV